MSSIVFLLALLIFFTQTCCDATEVDIWQSRNSKVSLATVVDGRYYQELDTTGRTPDGIFNSEAGNLQGTIMKARWQGYIGDEIRPFLFEVGYLNSSGNTRYRGYWQSGGSLIPLNATSRNNLSQLRMYAGLVLGKTELSQYVPIIEYRHLRWRRGLTQYNEMLTQHTVSAGLLGQWLLSDYFGLEGEILVGRHVKTRFEVPFFDFATRLPSKAFWSLSIEGSYQLDQHWSVASRYQRERSKTRRSPVINGVYLPPTKNDRSMFGVSISYHFD